MKVIEPGRPQQGWAKEYRCTGQGNGDGGCKALLLVEEGDLFYTYRSFMGRDEEWYTTFECPECGVWTDIKGAPFRPQNLPSHKKWHHDHNTLCKKVR